MKQPPARHRRERPAPEQRRNAKEASAREERMLDEALEETFPASDPPAATQPHGKSPGSRDDPAKPRFGAKKFTRKG